MLHWGLTCAAAKGVNPRGRTRRELGSFPHFWMTDAKPVVIAEQGAYGGDGLSHRFHTKEDRDRFCGEEVENLAGWYERAVVFSEE